MKDTLLLKYHINYLIPFLKKNSINEATAIKLEFFLKTNFTFISNLTLKHNIDKFQRVTINSRIF